MKPASTVKHDSIQYLCALIVIGGWSLNRLLSTPIVWGN
jgi:hypothetical protein